MRRLMQRFSRRFAATVTAAVLLVACASGDPIDEDGVKDGGDDGKADGGGSSTRDGAVDPPASDAGTGSGEPLTVPDGTWTYVDFADTQCRDGSPAGLAVSRNAESDKLMIFLEGGGACFDTLTCAGNPANAAGQRAEIKTGLFNRARSENPVKDWNVVYVPYCTGDVHGGTNADGIVDGVPQKFVGRRNLEKFLARIVPTFPDVDQVLLTGISAGGFGAALNVELVQRAFGEVPVTMIDDSGPPMSSAYVPECLQERWRTTWGFDQSFLADCGADCPNPNDYAIDYMKHVASTYPDRMGGLIETTGDSVITLFFGFGASDCMSFLPVPVSATTFEAGLLDFRVTAKSFDNFGTYYIADTTHTWLRGDSLYLRTSPDGVKLIDWYRDIIEGRAAAHVGP
jgi:hypothetical protein